MAEPSVPPPPPAPAAGPRPGLQPLWDAMRRTGVRRPKDDRWLGGVCSGVARRLGVDPVLLRVALVALTLLGGVGVVAYAVALVLLPDHDDRIELERAAYGDLTGTTVGAVGLLVLAMAVPGPWDLLRGGDLVDGGDLIGAVLVGSALLIGLALLPKLREAAERGPAGPPAPGSPAAGSPGPGSPGPSAPTSSAFTGPATYTAPAAGPPPTYQPPPPRPVFQATVVRPQRPGPGPAVAAASIGTSLVVGGTAWLLALLDLVPGRPWVVGAVCALAVLGVALVGLGLAGRRDGSVGGAAFVVVLVLLAALFVPSWRTTVLGGNAAWTPVDEREAERGGVLGLGDAVLDLSGLADVPEGAEVEIPVRVGIGGLDVLVPEDMAVTVRTGALVGTSDLVEERDGPADGSTSREGTVGLERTLLRAEDPQVVVDARVLVGNIQVIRTEQP